MALLETLRADRERRPGHQPWPQTPWAAVAAIVQAYGLTTPDRLEEIPPRAGLPGDRLSLCPLLSEAQYEVAQAILRRYYNPYLLYARSPGDIVLSFRLYQRCPDLQPSSLTAAPLAELWQQAAAATEVSHDDL